VVDEFVRLSIKNGIDVIRIFDALNDVRNLERAVKATKKFGGICEVALSYTASPVHTEEYFVELALELEKMGADNICVKDMANLLLPYQAYSLVTKLKQALKKETLVHMHTHNTTGTGDMVYLKSIEAGADIVDTALSPLANGTSQPATESLIATLQGTEYDTGIDINELTKATDHFRGVAEKLQKEGILDPKVLRVDVNTLRYQVPGGMLSNLISQLKQAGKSDLLYEVLAEVPRVRKDFGYPPLVTPTSQIVGTQAVMNVLAGERYKMNPKESQALMAGEYGRLPAPVNEEVRKKVIGDRRVITNRPADDLKPELENYRKEIGQYITQDEDVLSYALFPQVAEKFFQARQASQLKLDNSVFDKKNNAMPV
jgi:oxaloacetate decarboxylase alpha subunit